jgi:hypothetical protein
MANPTADTVKYDVTDVEPGGGGDWGGNGHQPKPGVVNATVVRAQPRLENRNGDKLETPDIEWVFEVNNTPGRAQAEEEDGAWLALYTKAAVRADSWSEAQVLEALGVITSDTKSRKGSFSRKAQIGKPVRLKIVADTFQREGDTEPVYRARIQRVMKPSTKGEASQAKAASEAEPDSGGGSEDEPPF